MLRTSMLSLEGSGFIFPFLEILDFRKFQMVLELCLFLGIVI